WSERLPLPSPETAINRAHAAQQRAQELLGHGDRSAASELVVTMLTQRARAALSGAGIYPASRGELPGQLIGIGELDLAEELRSALLGTWDRWDALGRVADGAANKTVSHS